MIRTARFAIVFAAAAAFAGAAYGQGVLQTPYTVRGLSIDETSSVSIQDARIQGTAKAKGQAAQRLIDRLTLQADRNAAQPPLTAAEVAAFASAGNVTEGDSKQSSTGGVYRYSGTIAQPFKPESMRQYLESRGIPYVDSQAGKALLVPAVAGGINAADWGAVWAETVPAAGGQPATTRGRVDETVLTPYVASVESWSRRPTFTDVQNELGASGANHAVVAEAYNQGGQIYVRLIDLRTGAPDTSGSVAGPFSSLLSAREGAITEMERQWKEQTIVRTSGSSAVQAVAMFRDLGEWVKIRKGLEASRLIKGLNIDSISQQGADVSFSFAGRPDQLANDLRTRGVSFGGQDGGWVLQVSQ